MLDKSPNVIHMNKSWYDNLNNCQSSKDGKHWYPSRPLGFYGIGRRIKAAWMVFTGKAGALVWPNGQ